MKHLTHNQNCLDRPVDCPCCERTFDVTDAKGAFIEQFETIDFEGLVYAMCPLCHEAYSAGDAQSRKAMSNRCFLNVKSDHREANLNKSWAVTTYITLYLNNDDLASAIWDGIDLPRPIYDAIVDGRLRICRAGPHLISGYWADEGGGDDGSL